MSNFKILSLNNFKSYVNNLNITRKIEQIHYHHTWRPRHSDYNGNNGIQLQESMRRYHVETLNWSDIGQHFTLLPDGKFVTGRDINKTPASIRDWNTGSIALEMLGDFNKNSDTLEGKQLTSALMFGALFIKKLNLKIENIIFHREHPESGVTCPGSGIDKEVFVKAMQNKLYNWEGIIMYNDYDEISEWARDAVKQLKKLGIMQGNDEGCFNPASPLTREENAVVIYNLLNFLGKI